MEWDSPIMPGLTALWQSIWRPEGQTRERADPWSSQFKSRSWHWKRPEHHPELNSFYGYLKHLFQQKLNDRRSVKLIVIHTTWLDFIPRRIRCLAKWAIRITFNLSKIFLTKLSFFILCKAVLIFLEHFFQELACAVDRICIPTKSTTWRQHEKYRTRRVDITRYPICQWFLIVDFLVSELWEIIVA